MKTAPTVLAAMACVLVAGCDDFDSLYGGQRNVEPEFSDPTDYSNDDDFASEVSSPDVPSDPGITPTLQ